jgi:peptide-methionine (S)-S-oxide reductase
LNLKNDKIAFGGGCHWCTEAVFQSLQGVHKVEQGYVASYEEYDSFSEAVIVYFDSEIISLNILIEIHLNTHKSTSEHSMRPKYRSAIYIFSDLQKEQALDILKVIQVSFQQQLVTKVLPFKNFRPSREEILNYYYKNPEKPFCETFINPKLKLIVERFSEFISIDKTKDLKLTTTQLQYK